MANNKASLEQDVTVPQRRSLRKTVLAAGAAGAVLLAPACTDSQGKADAPSAEKPTPTNNIVAGRSFEDVRQQALDSMDIVAKRVAKAVLYDMSKPRTGEAADTVHGDKVIGNKAELV